MGLLSGDASIASHIVIKFDLPSLETDMWIKQLRSSSLPPHPPLVSRVRQQIWQLRSAATIIIFAHIGHPLLAFTCCWLRLITWLSRKYIIAGCTTVIEPTKSIHSNNLIIQLKDLTRLPFLLKFKTITHFSKIENCRRIITSAIAASERSKSLAVVDGDVVGGEAVVAYVYSGSGSQGLEAEVLNCNFWNWVVIKSLTEKLKLTNWEILRRTVSFWWS